MAEKLRSVGLDVGTTTTQMILSELTVENRASAFAVPEMEITQRKILYESPVFFTPLLGQDRVDGEKLRELIAGEYEKAGISRQQVDTGAIIITGETSRKENARTVLENLSDFAGEFVVTTAGPDLESVLAAKGSGATEYSERTGKRVLHMDIGGGTSNLALIENGRIVKTGCLNVGGRLVKLDREGRVSYVSPAIQGLTELAPGMYPTQGQLEELTQILTQALEMAAGLREPTELLERLSTKEAGSLFYNREPVTVSFSGGVADCIEKTLETNAFGDIGPLLGRRISQSLLCRQPYVLGRQTIRATVIGAGCHSAQLSGSTVFVSGVQLPLKNLPVVQLSSREQDDPSAISGKLKGQDRTPVLAMPGYKNATYEQVKKLATAIAQGAKEGPVYLCLEWDMAKALGHALQLEMGRDRPCLCIDRVALQEGSFLDVGAPVGPALPVVIKTLVLSNTQ